MMRVCNCISHLTWINVRFHGDGLGACCTNGSYDFIEDFLYVATSSIALVIVLVIAWFGCKGLHKYKKMEFPLKALFYMASLSSVCFAILSVSTIILCLTSHKKEALTVGSISTFVYAFMLLCIWANLILRLNVAFKGTIYKMNKRQQTGYLIVFIYLVLNAFATSVCQLLLLDGQELAPSIWFQFGLGTAFMAVFAVSAMFAVCTFLKNVFILGKSRTVKQIKPFCEEEPIGLNQMQIKLMHLSAKYVSLFLLASLSSAISMFSGFYESASDLRISLFLLPVDCSVNLLCIYLQYAFAEKHYNRYCGKLDSCCKRVMTAGWVQSIHTMRREEYDLKVQNQRDIDIENKKVFANLRTIKTIPDSLSTQIRQSGLPQQQSGEWTPKLYPNEPQNVNVIDEVNEVSDGIVATSFLQCECNQNA